MINILVLGGGFAGVWSAASAVRAARESGVPASELRVTLVSDGDDMVIRPRLYERDPAQMRVSLDRVLRADRRRAGGRDGDRDRHIRTHGHGAQQRGTDDRAPV